MPKIEIKESTLNGQADLIKYENRPFFYLRVNRGGKRYTNVSLETSNIAQAHKNALSAYVKVEKEPPKSRTRKLSFEKVCEEYLKEKELEVNRGQLAPRSQEVYRQRVYQRILPFCKLKGIRCISDINKNSFLEYGNHYLDVTHKGKWKNQATGLSASTINGDLTTLMAVLNWMLQKELLDPKSKPVIKKVKDRKNYRDEANPAFLPDDWEFFRKQLFLIEKNIADEETTWKRTSIINWILFQQQSGCRPHESMQIRLGDCEITRRADGKLGAIVRISNTSKTGGRDVVLNGNTVQRIKSHLNKGIKLRNKQIEAFNRMVDQQEIFDRQGNLVTAYKKSVEAASKDDLLFMNPFLEGRTVYHIEHIRQWFNRVLRNCDFDRKYTLYSLRATHISFALLKGQRVDLVAKNCGTSLAMIQKTYDGLSSRYHIDSLGFFKEAQQTIFEDDL